MKKLVIDIETVGIPWEELDGYVREFLLRGVSEGEVEEMRRAGGLSPFRGRIVTIGVINLEDGRSCALYEVPGQTDLRIEKAGARTFISGTEKQILEKFWEFFEPDSRFISFNGRQFDGPFLMIRSAINGVRPVRDLCGQRYELHPNCDLREVLSFFGTPNFRQFRFNLDLACKAFGVMTSKSEGHDGRDVEPMYRAGRYREIAEYCLEDVRATGELYQKLVPTLLMLNWKFRESEERDAKNRRDDQMTLMPTNESAFMESVTQTSIALTESLGNADPEPVAAAASHQAFVFEKLMKTNEPEDDIELGS
jgi:predicted PolB exonuclease-like 3'-5' exonuclease